MTSIALPPLSATMFHSSQLLIWPAIRSLAVLAAVTLTLCAWWLRSRMNRVKRRVPSFSTPDQDEKPRLASDSQHLKTSSDQIPYTDYFPRLDRLADEASPAERRRMVADKELYWKLQNLEDHPGMLVDIPQWRQADGQTGLRSPVIELSGCSIKPSRAPRPLLQIPSSPSLPTRTTGSRRSCSPTTPLRPRDTRLTSLDVKLEDREKCFRPTHTPRSGYV